MTDSIADEGAREPYRFYAHNNAVWDRTTHLTVLILPSNKRATDACKLLNALEDENRRAIAMVKKMGEKLHALQHPDHHFDDVDFPCQRDLCPEGRAIVWRWKRAALTQGKGTGDGTSLHQ